MKRYSFPLLCATFLSVPVFAAPIPFYIGTYTSTSESLGIYRATFDGETGVLSVPTLSAKVQDPAFLAMTPDGKTLLAVSETQGGSVHSFEVNSDGSLRELSRQPSEGAAPCHLALDRGGHYVVVANYAGGTVSAFPLSAEGTLAPASGVKRHQGTGPVAARQEAAHPHGVHYLPGGRQFMVPDLGTDRVEVYRLDSSGRVVGGGAEGFAMPPGSGPRHCAVSGGTVWVLNELSCTVVEARREADGTWRLSEPISTLPSGWQGTNTCAEILVHPGGKWVYATNRGHDSVARFERKAGGGLRFLGTTPTGGKTPRNAALSPDGGHLIVANQDSGTLGAFRVDSHSGDLHPVGKPVQVPKPVCVLFAQQTNR